MTERPCPFCTLDAIRIVGGNDLAVALRDGFPVSPGHTLVIPRRHVATWFDATPAEREAILALTDVIRAGFDASWPRPDGYNIGINVGEAAGQTVMHLHVHLIPRYKGDVDDPRGGVRYVIPEKGNYHCAGHVPRSTREPSLTTGGTTDPFLSHLKPVIAQATSVDILAAFVQQSGVDLVRSPLVSALQRRARIRVLTGDYLNITQAQAIRSLRDLERATRIPDDDEDVLPPGTIDVRVVEVESLRAFARSFHPKCWVLEGPAGGVAFVGSSNLSSTALRDGVEWNLRLESARDPSAFDEIRTRWNEIWSRGREVDDAWLDAYEARARTGGLPLPPGDAEEAGASTRLPPLRDVQEEALDALERSRAKGRTRALVVMATGTGKTRVAVEDAIRFGRAENAPRVLYLAHRAELLAQAARTFEAVRPGIHLAWFVGSFDDFGGEVVLGSVQKLRRNLSRFHSNAFDYVVVDEVHHAAAPTYRAILRRLAPRFLLGLTATPERADAGDILGLFDDHVAYRADIGEGISRGHLVPFRYFGLKDPVNYEPIPWRNGRFDPEILASAVATRDRMEATWSAWQAHPATRTLVFCCSVAHADFVKTWLAGKGLRVVAVHTGPGSDDRDDALQRLDAGALDAVCAVDLFNEGVDVPRVDRVVMLRPTESSLLFLQQLGRGLRRPEAAEKTDLLVLDFVGNHRMFLDRVRQLLNLVSAGQSRSITDLIRNRGKMDLPRGCSVDLDLEAVDLLRRLLPSGEGHVFERTYREVRDARGTRPTLGEMYRMCRNPAALQAFSGWFGFVDSEGNLTKEEKRVLFLDRVGAFLQALERREAMDKCFKMVTLQALLEAGAFMEGMAVPELARRSHEIILRSPELFQDIEGVRELPDPRAPRPAAWERYWRKNPIHFWTEGASARRGQAWFHVQGDRFQPTFSVPQDLIPTLEVMVAELVDYRLARYRRNRKEEWEAGTGSFVCKVSHSRQGPILFLPDRKKVTGIPVGDEDVRVPDGRYWRFRFVSIACNVAHPVGSSANQLPDLLRTWFGPHAGASGTMFQVRFRPSPDGWWIEPLDAEGAEVVPLAGRGQVVVFPTLQAAAGWETAELAADDVPPEVVALPGPSVPDAFAVRVCGSSMEGWPSVIRDGDWLVLRYARSMGIGSLDGRIVVVRKGDPGGKVSYHVKRVVRTDKGLVLRSDHPDVGDRPVQAGDEVFAEIVQVVRPEDIGPATGTVLQVSEIAGAFGIHRAPASGTSRVDGHLFLVVDSLSSPDRVESDVPDRRPGETAFVLGSLDGDRVRYLGVGRWSAEGWEIPEVSFETWRTLGHGRSASRRLDPRWRTAASTLVSTILATTRLGEVHEIDSHPFRILGSSGRAAVRISGPEGGFEERTVSDTDLAWVLAAEDLARRDGALLNEAFVNRCRYLDGTPKGSTRWVDTQWAIRLLKLTKGWEAS